MRLVAENRAGNTLAPSLRKLRVNEERRQAMGDKGGKKDKEKSQNQNAKKQQETSKKKLDKQPKRTP